MARPSRTRRGKRGDFQAPAQAERTRARRREVRPVQQSKSQAGAQRDRRGGFRAFAAESWGELKKVEWPGRKQLISATVVVLIAIAVTGAYLAAADFVASRFVRDVLLNF